MNLSSTITLYGGGPGSGCQGPTCGRHVIEKIKGIVIAEIEEAGFEVDE